jgi:hypothetical protein
MSTRNDQHIYMTHTERVESELRELRASHDALRTDNDLLRDANCRLRADLDATLDREHALRASHDALLAPAKKALKSMRRRSASAEGLFRELELAIAKAEEIAK